MISRGKRKCAVALGFLVATALSACTSPSPKASGVDRRDGEACGRVVTETPLERHAMGSRTRATYGYARGLWVYEASADTLVRVRAGSQSPRGFRPRTRGDQIVSFVDERRRSNDKEPFPAESLYELDLSSRDATEVLRLSKVFRAHSWSPDGRFLAYQVPTLSASVVCIYDARQETTGAIRVLGTDHSSHASQSDEQSIAWSPDGDSILIVDSSQSPNVYVVDRRGVDRVPARQGTFGRWMPDGRSVLLRDALESGKPGQWIFLDVGSGRTRPAGIPAKAFRPTISPDGTLVAYDDGDPRRPTTYVYEFKRGVARLLIAGYGAPIWLGSGLVAVTQAAACPPDAECNGWWVPLGRTVGIDIETDKARPLKMQTTLSEDRVSPLDVLVASS